MTPSYLDDPDANPLPRPPKTEPELLAAEDAIRSAYDAFLESDFLLTVESYAEEMVEQVKKDLLSGPLSESAQFRLHALKSIYEEIHDGRFINAALQRALERLRKSGERERGRGAKLDQTASWRAALGRQDRRAGKRD